MNRINLAMSRVSFLSMASQNPAFPPPTVGLLHSPVLFGYLLALATLCAAETKTQSKSNLIKEVLFGSQFECTVHRGREVMEAGPWGDWWPQSQKAERNKSWCSAGFAVSIQSRTPTSRNVPPHLEWISLSWLIESRKYLTGRSWRILGLIILTININDYTPNMHCIILGVLQIRKGIWLLLHLSILFSPQVFKKYFKIFLCARMPFLHMKSMPAVPQGPEESNGSLALELQMVEAWCGCREGNCAPLQKEQVLLTTQQSLQLLHISCYRATSILSSRCQLRLSPHHYPWVILGACQLHLSPIF